MRDLEMARARRRNRDHIKRAALSDITAAQENEMRRRTRKCPMPGCGKYMTNKPNLPNSKHLDHIIPISQGGTHTHGNVRIICADCNLRRPKDGSDYFGPVTLFAVMPGVIARPHGSTNRATCRKGLHPWVPENIQIKPDGKRCCKLCRYLAENNAPKKTCKCGALFAAPGRTFMCPACTDATAREAAELHGSGLTWDQVAAQVGYDSGTGAWYAAKRIGYTAKRVVPERVAPEPVHARCACGAELPKFLGSNRSCEACRARVAWQAVAMRKDGMTLREIADHLGYDSITTVTNLLKTVTETEWPRVRVGRPRKSAA